jgi:hypothetical protein
MKRSALFALLASLSLAVGCQDSQLTNPVDSPTSSTDVSLAKAAQAPSNVIILNADIPMNNATHLTQLVHISGRVKFSVALEPIMAGDFYRVALALSANLSSLSDPATALWSFGGESVDRVQFSPILATNGSQPSASLTKTYITGNEDRTVVLTVVYRVTSTSVSVQSMSCAEYIH